MSIRRSLTHDRTTAATSTKDLSGVEHARSYLGRQVEEIERTEPIVRLHAVDEEAVHDREELVGEH